MKKLITIIIITYTFLIGGGLISGAQAQQNGGFENWSPSSSYENPDYWQTLNILTLTSPPNPISVFKATGVDKHSGNYALKIKTVFMNNNPAPQLLVDSVGYVFTGTIVISPPLWKIGIPYTARPEKLEFWSKYTPVGNDIAGVDVTLKKWNGTSSDTVAFGEVTIDTTIAYTFFQLHLNYRSPAFPDTLIISFASSHKLSTSRVGSTLCIDDIALTGWLGIDESRKWGNNKTKVFPNPAKGNVTVETTFEEADNLRLMDASGKLNGVFKIQNLKTTINTSSFAQGCYLFEITDKKDRILTTGKFNVVK